MDVLELREKLHEYIETADERHLAAIYTLVGDDATAPADVREYDIDEETIHMLHERQAEHKSGEAPSYTEEEVFAYVRSHKK